MTRGIKLFIIALVVQGLGSTANAATVEIAQSAEQVHPVLVGTQIPDVEVRNSAGKKVRLRAEVSRQPTVLVIYRGGWCPYCNTQLKELKDAESALMKAGFQILAVSADRVEEIAKTREKHAINYKLYSDNQLEAAKAFGLAFHVDDAMLEKYKGYGIDLEKASGEKHHLLPVPAVFIIGKDGEIKFEFVNPNYKVRLKAEVLLAAAKAYAEK